MSAQDKLLVRAAGEMAGQVPTALGRAPLGELAPSLPTLCLALAVANSSSHQCNKLMLIQLACDFVLAVLSQDSLCFNFPKPSSAFCCFLKPLPKYGNELWPMLATFAGVQILEQKGPKANAQEAGLSKLFCRH